MNYSHHNSFRNDYLYDQTIFVSNNPSLVVLRYIVLNEEGNHYVVYFGVEIKRVCSTAVIIVWVLIYFYSIKTSIYFIAAFAGIIYSPFASKSTDNPDNNIFLVHLEVIRHFAHVQISSIAYRSSVPFLCCHLIPTAETHSGNNYFPSNWILLKTWVFPIL